MIVIKPGKKINREEEFYFKCSDCGCEWTANRGDKGLEFSPPCFEFYVYMKCPHCHKTAYYK